VAVVLEFFLSFLHDDENAAKKIKRGYKYFFISLKYKAC